MATPNFMTTDTYKLVYDAQKDSTNTAEEFQRVMLAFAASEAIRLLSKKANASRKVVFEYDISTDIPRKYRVESLDMLVSLGKVKKTTFKDRDAWELV